MDQTSNKRPGADMGHWTWVCKKKGNREFFEKLMILRNFQFQSPMMIPWTNLTECSYYKSQLFSSGIGNFSIESSGELNNFQTSTNSDILYLLIYTNLYIPWNFDSLNVGKSSA